MAVNKRSKPGQGIVVDWLELSKKAGRNDFFYYIEESIHARIITGFILKSYIDASKKCYTNDTYKALNGTTSPLRPVVVNTPEPL
jgi:hypothetical protein